MRIKTNSFKKFESILNEFFSRGLGSEQTEGIYLNFEDSYAYVRSMDGIAGRFKFEFQKESDDKIENFYININKFLNLCHLSENLELDNAYVFHTDTGTFRLKYLKEDYIDSVELFEENGWNKNNIGNVIIFDKEKFNKLKIATQYMYKKALDFSYKGVYIQDGYIFSVLQDQIYESEFDFNCGTPIIIYNELANFISMLGENTKMFSGDKVDNIVSDDDDLEIIMPKFNIAIPPVREEIFIERYNVKSRIRFNKEELSLAIATLHPYFKLFPLKRIFIEIQNEKCIFRFEEEGEIAKIDVETENIVDLMDIVIEIDGETIKKAISHLSGDTIDMIYNSKYPQVCMKAVEDDSTKILLSLIDRT